MLQSRVLNPTSGEILEFNCAYCQTQFKTMDRVVQCPNPGCGRWYHIHCWVDNDNHCSIHNCIGSGEVDAFQADEAYQEDYEEADFIEILDRIQILHEISNIDSNSIDLTSGGLEELAHTKSIEVKLWEIHLANMTKQPSVEGFFTKIGLKRIFDRFEGTTNYFFVIGFFIILLLMIFFLAAIILISITPQ
jgi:hypothetical protein